MQAVEPSSPLEARTEMPAAAANASAPSVDRTPAETPIDSSSAGSQVPSEAEMTAGVLVRFCSGAVSERSTSAARADDS